MDSSLPCSMLGLIFVWRSRECSFAQPKLTLLPVLIAGSLFMREEVAIFKISTSRRRRSRAQTLPNGRTPRRHFQSITFLYRNDIRLNLRLSNYNFPEV